MKVESIWCNKLYTKLVNLKSKLNPKWRNRNFLAKKLAKNKTGIGVPDTGFLCERLFRPAKIYMIQILDIFACETFGKTNWTPFKSAYTLISRNHICSVVASLDLDFGFAIQLDRGSGQNFPCVFHLLILIRNRPPPLGAALLCLCTVFSVDGCRNCCDYLAVPLASEWLLFPGSLRLS